MVGRKVSSSMKLLVWVTGGIPHLCLSPVLPSEHLLQTWRGWGAAAVTHSRSAELNVSLPIFLQARRPSALHPIPLPSHDALSVKLQLITMETVAKSPIWA